MKSLIAFLQVLLTECGERCGVSTTRDLTEITRRVEHEGESFLTISLASFGKDFQKSLDRGFVDRNSFQGFSWRAGLPRLFGGFLDQVFDRCTGRLLDSPSLDAILVIPQLTLSFAKINLPCSDERNEAALRRYIECEQEIRISDSLLTDELSSSFRRIGRMLWADLFTQLDFRVYCGDLLPKHGAGSTADSLRGNAKWDQTEWTDRLEEYFPSGEFLYNRWTRFIESPPTFLEPGAERPVKVITVPKTLKTPRIIAMEPTCMQYVQQAIHEMIQEEMRRFDNPRSFVCYDSQEPNRVLARRGSLTGEFATLDLSEASDRVSNQHVRLLLADHPHLFGGVDACRSRKADVLGQTIRLAKFASMGSALCFPFEAMVFATIIFVGIERALSRQLTTEDIQSFRGRVRVYGDDIIVPVDFTSEVVDCLESFGMKVNQNKSFWTGKFRESCGGEFYDGRDISYARVRSRFPSDLGDVEEIISTVALRNHLYSRGFFSTVEWMDTWLCKLLPAFPFVHPDSPGLGRWTFEPIQAERFHSQLHIPLVKACVPEFRIPVNEVDGYGALMKWFLKRGTLPFADRDHLRRSGRAGSARIRTRWISPGYGGEIG